MVLELKYVGNLSRKLPTHDMSINQVPPDQMGPGNAQVRRPFPQFNNVQLALPTLGISNYHAGSVRLEKRFSSGFSFLTNYTWARNLGNLDNSGAGEIGDNQLFQDFYNRRDGRGPNAIDTVHRFMWSSVYDLPWGAGRTWLQDGILSHVLGGWTFGTIAQLQSGGPFTVQMQTNTTNAFSIGALRPNLLRDPNLPSSQRTVGRWFDTDAFEAPPPYTFGNAGRGILRADGRISVDVSLNKRFAFGENRFVQFRGEFLNVLNHADFRPPNQTVGSAAFGTISEATDPRTIQLGLRIVF